MKNSDTIYSRERGVCMKPKVYFSKTITPEKVLELYKLINKYIIINIINKIILINIIYSSINFDVAIKLL